MSVCRHAATPIDPTGTCGSRHRCLTSRYLVFKKVLTTGVRYDRLSNWYLVTCPPPPSTLPSQSGVLDCFSYHNMWTMHSKAQGFPGRSQSCMCLVTWCTKGTIHELTSFNSPSCILSKHLPVCPVVCWDGTTRGSRYWQFRLSPAEPHFPILFPILVQSDRFIFFRR